MARNFWMDLLSGCTFIILVMIALTLSSYISAEPDYKGLDQFIKPGMLVQYQCGCTWRLSTDIDLSRRIPKAPPLRCEIHGMPSVKTIYPSEL